jgi:hypothetical protein
VSKPNDIRNERSGRLDRQGGAGFRRPMFGVNGCGSSLGRNAFIIMKSDGQSQEENTWALQTTSLIGQHYLSYGMTPI